MKSDQNMTFTKISIEMHVETETAAIFLILSQIFGRKNSNIN